MARSILSDAERRALDALCVTDVRLGVSRLVWLGREARSASPAQIVAQLEKLAFLRELGASDWQLETVSANRRRQLAALARRSTTAALAGRPERLRYPRSPSTRSTTRPPSSSPSCAAGPSTSCS
jgi:hypothetical protein